MNGDEYEEEGYFDERFVEFCLDVVEAQVPVKEV